MKKNYLLSLLCIVTSFVHALSIAELQQLTRLPPHEIQKALEFIAGVQYLCDTNCPYQHVLPRIINTLNLKVGCEIGVAAGTHCKSILETTHVTKLYGIDPYFDYPDPTNVAMNQKWFDIYYYKVKDRLSPFGKRFELIRDFSVKAVNRFKDNELDFVFIDANHVYEFVLQDIDIWYKKVRQGGIISGDDYATVHPGVPRAVNDFFGKLGLKVNTDYQHPRVWWVQKP